MYQSPQCELSVVLLSMLCESPEGLTETFDDDGSFVW